MAPLITMVVIVLSFLNHRSFSEYIGSPPANCSSSCGQIRNITSPFRLTTDPSSCGDLRYELSCENNHTVMNYEDKYLRVNRRYIVQAINYNNNTIRIADSNITQNGCFIPANSLYFPYSNRIYFDTKPRKSFSDMRPIQKIILFNCERRVLNSPSYIDASPCSFGTYDFPYSYYYLVEGEFSSSDLILNCRIEAETTFVPEFVIPKTSFGIRNALLYGVELSWIRTFDKSGLSYYCYGDSGRIHCESVYKSSISAHLQYYLVILNGYKYVVGFLGPRLIIGVSFVIALFIYKWRRRHSSTYDDIEEFLQRHANLMPTRYSYSNIRKMTKGFKEKLGEGGFGAVYKGRLSSGAEVAIKMGKSKGNGQDFVNEVATIGRIHHMNVVRLVGFCVEGLNRVLVYEFMPNGSLEIYIFSKKGELLHESLCLEKIFDISLGVARGIEYLHKGCDMQILHFDIKPHNILLDDNFVPRVSDFGLARLCPSDDSMTSLTAARGTIGYIAPEFFYKNIGGVSHKSDVYSFGMLLMEMANKRRNVNADANNTSEIYFPSWIYGQFSQGKGMEKDDATEVESRQVKKMIIVALWCIQLKPCDRPSMSKVIEMLEQELEGLQMPPKLCLYPQEHDQENYSVSNDDPSDGKSREASFISNSF